MCVTTNPCSVRESSQKLTSKDDVLHKINMKVIYGIYTISRIMDNKENASEGGLTRSTSCANRWRAKIHKAVLRYLKK